MTNQTPEIVCLGEAVIDISPPRRGENIVTTGEMRLAAGGAPANVAVALARLGTAAGFLGKVGQDFFGQHLVAVLSENGVDVSHLKFERNANTGLAFVSWDEQGDATYLFYRRPSADSLLAPADIDGNYIQQARVLQFGSLLLATEPSASATYQALRLAADAGVLLSYDLNLRVSGWPDEATARADVAIPLPFAHILKLNRHELSFLTGETDLISGTQKLWSSHQALVVVTLDKEGCFYRTHDATGFVPNFAVEVADTVGAGDAFMAGLLDGLRRNDYNFENETLIRQACRQANATGALATTRAGAIPALPTRAEVDQLLQNSSIN